tara:strand:- start:139 stop:381 length:243 start_codon:yes stop_codon:yes gene_type:complete
MYNELKFDKANILDVIESSIIDTPFNTTLLLLDVEYITLLPIKLTEFHPGLKLYVLLQEVYIGGASGGGGLGGGGLGGGD